MLVHCCRKFRPEEILFLYDSPEFSHRKIEIGTCMECNKLIVKLTERRILDGKVFETNYKSGKAQKCLNEHRNQVQYSSLDILPQTKVLFGFRYGINKEFTNKKTGKTVNKQYSCDFYGNKEVVKTF